MLPKGFIFTWAIARIIATSRREAMGLYEQEGAVAAIARSRTALATGKMRLALAGAETLGGCGGGGDGDGSHGGWRFSLHIFFKEMIYPGLSMCFRSIHVFRALNSYVFVKMNEGFLGKNVSIVANRLFTNRIYMNPIDLILDFRSCKKLITFNSLQ